jgi:hypothetical protein
LVALLLTSILVGAGFFSNFRGVAITKSSLRDDSDGGIRQVVARR